MINTVKDIIKLGLEGVLRFIPDKNQREEAREYFELQVLGSLTSLVQGQLDINKQEAKHTSIFVAGWRPAVGWVCVAGLGWNYLVQPLFTWLAFMLGANVEGVPELDINELVTILLGMLGLGGLRTYEKRLGVARSSMK